MAFLARGLGVALRETGQALDRLGCVLVGNGAFKEQLSRHRAVMPLAGVLPKLPVSGFIAPNASVIGNVTVGENSSIWYGAVLRGDVNPIKIGSQTNIQDGTIIHVAKHNIANVSRGTTVGSRVTIGHNAVLHACTVEDDSFIGMSATLMDGVVVKKGAMVAAGAVVTPGTVVPSGELFGGFPAKKLRAMTAEEIAYTSESAKNYALLAAEHSTECGKSFEQIEADKEARDYANELSPDYAEHIGIKHPAAIASA